MKGIICDIDGTLANLNHRLSYVRDGAKDWDRFFAECHKDSLYVSVAKVVDAMYRQDYAVLLVSGRPERCRDVTRKWLAENDILYDHLYMRPDDDSRPDHVVKSQILDAIIAEGYDIEVVFDDRASVIEMWRERGLTCLQCAPSMVSIPPTAALTLMVGPSCAGKSSWLRTAEAQALGIWSSQVISSDDVRSDLCGDFRDQSKNAEVFSAIHAIAKTRLLHGLPTVIDATHIKRRDRVQAATLVDCRVRYIVMNRIIDVKRRDGGWRNQVKKDGQPFDLIAAHEQTFKSQLKEILAGDNLPNVTVLDLRQTELAKAA